MTPSEPTQGSSGASGSDPPTNGSPSPESEKPSSGEPPTPKDEEQYDARYVRSLRAEAKGHRERAERAESQLAKANERIDALTERSVRAEVSQQGFGQLQDPQDLLAFVPLSELLTEDGEPSEEKIKAAIKELLQKKPHLSVKRQASLVDVGQGQGNGEKPAEQSFADFMKATVR